ncbi:CocE/NonD family hydrolase [Aestuariibaculum sediminum]|uniref:CocE/NonD family hydrolase n=1 Tax=Aestuariibaculum sediminum TaxID=2770637 RepID=A0A8J6Q2R5_9FLAO|nr:CocE/NonD family hydrolase [Aestuariibaculum sediminum]MBD0832549.1 CocE/NonD family hydrolase [Aestuariibaculum sediminum]
MKKFSISTKYLIDFNLVVGLFGSSCGSEKKSEESQSRISKPGAYAGYSEVVYAADYHISSQYIEMRDGVKLAVDIYRHKDKSTGAVTEKPLLVLWMHTPYNRLYNGYNSEKLTVNCYAGTVSELIKYGYVVATVDFRGLDASYGHNEAFNRGEWGEPAAYDAYDVTEWLALQPWSYGNIGMWGCSATGDSQMQVPTTAPPHLKAMFPMSFDFDTYAFRVPRGIGNLSRWPNPDDGLTHQQRRDNWAATVDGDEDSTLLKEAIKEHKGTAESAGYIPFCDGYSNELTNDVFKQWWVKSSPSTYLDEINQSGVGMYMAVNWDEGYTKHGAYFAFNNITTPSKIIMGLGGHCDWLVAEELTGFDIVTEELRFFDYWLKGIDNGIMEENPVYYYTYNAPRKKEWQLSKTWPLVEMLRVKYYLGKGALCKTHPVDEGLNVKKVSYDFSTGADGAGELIYETAPSEKDIQLTGHPEIKLWVSFSATDGDFVATIQDVAPDCRVSSYYTQGQLRASIRKQSELPYNNLDLPWHSGLESDVEHLVHGKPTLLEFPILSISMIFKVRHKIQLVISFAGRGTPKVEPAPEVSIYRDSDKPSYLVLPIIE